MSKENIRQEKQKYLRENVLDKGFSADDFVEYMQSLRGMIILLELF